MYPFLSRDTKRTCSLRASGLTFKALQTKQIWMLRHYTHTLYLIPLYLLHNCFIILAGKQLFGTGFSGKVISQGFAYLLFGCNQVQFSLASGTKCPFALVVIAQWKFIYTTTITVCFSPIIKASVRCPLSTFATRWLYFAPKKESVLTKLYIFTVMWIRFSYMYWKDLQFEIQWPRTVAVSTAAARSVALLLGVML